MTAHQQQHFRVPASADPGGQVAQLRQILDLVGEIAGLPLRHRGDSALDEAARIGAAYDDALPIDRRRFDRLAAEIAGWAAAGVEALLAAEERGCVARPAAGRLAEALDRALKRLSAILAS